MRKYSRKRLASMFLGSVFYLAQADVGFSQSQVQNTYPVDLTTASATRLVQDNSLVPRGQYEWQALLELAAIPDSVVTLKVFEHAFGQKAVHSEQAGFNFYRIRDIATLSLTSDEITRKRYPQRTSRTVIFHVLGGHTSETCITRVQVVKGLQSLGWALHSHSVEKLMSGNFKEWTPSRATPSSDTFLKGDDGIISIFYWEGTECANSASMQTDKFTFDNLIKSTTKSLSENDYD